MRFPIFVRLTEMRAVQARGVRRVPSKESVCLGSVYSFRTSTTSDPVTLPVLKVNRQQPAEGGAKLEGKTWSPDEPASCKVSVKDAPGGASRRPRTRSEAPTRYVSGRNQGIFCDSPVARSR